MLPVPVPILLVKQRQLFPMTKLLDDIMGVDVVDKTIARSSLMFDVGCEGGFEKWWWWWRWRLFLASIHFVGLVFYFNCAPEVQYPSTVQFQPNR